MSTDGRVSLIDIMTGAISDRVSYLSHSDSVVDVYLPVRHMDITAFDGRHDRRRHRIVGDGPSEESN